MVKHFKQVPSLGFRSCQNPKYQFKSQKSQICQEGFSAYKCEMGIFCNLSLKLVGQCETGLQYNLLMIKYRDRWTWKRSNGTHHRKYSSPGIMWRLLDNFSIYACLCAVAKFNECYSCIYVNLTWFLMKNF